MIDLKSALWGLKTGAKLPDLRGDPGDIARHWIKIAL